MAPFRPIHATVVRVRCSGNQGIPSRRSGKPFCTGETNAMETVNAAVRSVMKTTSCELGSKRNDERIHVLLRVEHVCRDALPVEPIRRDHFHDDAMLLVQSLVQL